MMWMIWEEWKEHNGEKLACEQKVAASISEATLSLIKTRPAGLVMIDLFIHVLEKRSDSKVHWLTFGLRVGEGETQSFL